MFAQLLTGIGLVAAGAGLAIRSAHRRPVPADVKAQIVATLQSQGSFIPLVDAYTKANNPYRHQVTIVAGATSAANDAKLPADIAALYRSALQSANPATMKQIASSLSAKNSHLAGLLNDVAKILGG